MWNNPAKALTNPTNPFFQWIAKIFFIRVFELCKKKISPFTLKNYRSLCILYLLLPIIQIFFISHDSLIAFLISSKHWMSERELWVEKVFNLHKIYIFPGIEWWWCLRGERKNFKSIFAYFSKKNPIERGKIKIFSSQMFHFKIPIKKKVFKSIVGGVLSSFRFAQSIFNCIKMK